MKYRLFKTNQFKRSYKKLKLLDSEEQAYIDVAYKLLNDIELDKKYHKHTLKGEYQGFEECHLKPDLLLVYIVEEGVLKFVDIGTHSELFD